MIGFIGTTGFLGDLGLWGLVGNSGFRASGFLGFRI